MRTEVRGRRSEVRGQGSGNTIANCKLQIANCKLTNANNGEWTVGGEQCENARDFSCHSSCIIRHSVKADNKLPATNHLPPTTYHLPFSPRPSRSGISLIEVLISIFVLSIGLLGVAALIPLGQLSLWETAKADRSGACGRAAMRDIQVRRMLDYRYWYWQKDFWGDPIADDFATVSNSSDAFPFVIDPLGYLNYASSFATKPELRHFGDNPTANVFLLRRTLRSAPLSPTNIPLPMFDDLARQLFFWSDDLPFDAPKNSSERPRMVTSGGAVLSEGGYSWFFSVTPAATEMSLTVGQRRLFNVSVAVCYKRNLQPGAVGTFDGEHVASIPALAGFPGMGIGGGTVILDRKVNVKENQWVMLYHVSASTPQRNRCNWYRVVGVGMDVAGGPTVSLNGPDWDPNMAATMVVVPGVIGVYTTTMELDWDPLWTK